VLHVQTTAFDYYVRATLQSMCRTETSEAVNISRFNEDNSSIKNLADNAAALHRHGLPPSPNTCTTKTTMTLQNIS